MIKKAESVSNYEKKAQTGKTPLGPDCDYRGNHYRCLYDYALRVLVAAHWRGADCVRVLCRGELLKRGTK